MIHLVLISGGIEKARVTLRYAFVTSTVCNLWVSIMKYWGRSGTPWPDFRIYLTANQLPKATRARVLCCLVNTEMTWHLWTPLLREICSVQENTMPLSFLKTLLSKNASFAYLIRFRSFNRRHWPSNFKTGCLPRCRCSQRCCHAKTGK